MPEADRQKMEEALKALKDALAGTDIEAVKRAHEALGTASNDFTRQVYQNVQAQQSAGDAGPGAQPSDDEVADAEIVDDDQQSA